MFAGGVNRRWVSRMRRVEHWPWHLDELHVKPKGEMVFG